MRWDERGSASIPVSEMTEEELLRLALELLYHDSNEMVNDSAWISWTQRLKDNPEDLALFVSYLRIGTGR